MNIVVRDSDNAILMHSLDASPEPLPGSRLIILDEQQSAELQSLMDSPHGGITFDGNIFTAMPPPPPPSPPTPEQKLTAAGLTIDELKQMLGL